MKAIATRIKEDRESRQETQKDYAERTGLSQPFIAQVESGARGLGVDSFMKLCLALNWTPEYLYYGKGVREMDERSRLEQELLTVFRKASAEDQRKIIGSVRGYVGDIPPSKRGSGVRTPASVYAFPMVDEIVHNGQRSQKETGKPDTSRTAEIIRIF